MATPYSPNYAVHPGEILKQTLETHNMSQRELAERTGITPKQINEIIGGKSGISPESAMKFEYVFNVSSTFWNGLQKNYQEVLARLEQEKRFKDELETAKLYTCYNEIADFGFVEKARKLEDKFKNLLLFFGVSSLSYVPRVQGVAFRKAPRKGSPQNLAVWLRCGDIAAKSMELPSYNRGKLEELIPQLRAMTGLGPERYSIQIKELCKGVGIAVVYTPYLSKTHINGASRWLPSGNPIIQLSQRSLRSDVIWFTFFHEVAHILRHGKKGDYLNFKEDVRLEFDNSNDSSEEERDADEYASNILTPRTAYKKFIARGDFTHESIKIFAQAIAISPDVVAGRLAHEGLITWQAAEPLRRRVSISV